MTTRAPAYHFGPATQPLFGWLHRAPRLRPRSAAVLLCNPLGEEASRAHRVYRVLASQLERAGYPVLRFDYSGTGDSSGRAEDVSVEAWLDDTAAAGAELARVAPKAKLVLVGLRFGATLAALASSQREIRAKHLVLWDPVVDGHEYLRELGAAHRAFMRHEQGARYVDRLSYDDGGAPNEALGTPLGDVLVRGMRGVDLRRSPPRADHVTVLVTRASGALGGLRETIGGRAGVRWIDQPETEAWNTDEALNAATVPMNIVQSITNRIEEVSP